MINPLEKGVCNKHKAKKVFCDHCGVFRYCYAPPVCKLKKITLVTKIKVYINLPGIFFQTTTNQTFQSVKRRKEN